MADAPGEFPVKGLGRMTHFFCQAWRSCSILFVLLLLFAPGLGQQARAESAEAGYMPWSGYWWPTRLGGLGTGKDYRGHPAPLEKYDLLTFGRYPGLSTSWYLENYYDPDAPAWWGLCAEWALSSIYERYSILPSSIDNIVFRVGDKKGLLALSHNNDIAERADGSRPEIFHYWLLHYIGDEKQAFVADLDSGEEVWSYSIFKYEMNESVNGNIKSVTVTVYYADDMVDPDYIGTKILSEQYTYDLTLNQNGEIVDGIWTGLSVHNHPDGLSFPLVQRGTNKWLDYSKVLEIAKSKDDFLEDGEAPVVIGPGTYNLVLLDKDVYRLICSSNDTLLINVSKQPGSQEDMRLVISDGQGVSHGNYLITDDQPAKVAISCQDPPYNIEIEQDNPESDPNIYTLMYDLYSTASKEVFYIPKNGMWSGFAITNSNTADAKDIMLVTYDQSGMPIQTLFGPFDLKAGEKRLFFFDDLNWRRHEYPSIARASIFSHGEISVTNLFGDSGAGMAGFINSGVGSNTIIIPDIMVPVPGGTLMKGAVINPSQQSVTADIRVFADNGALFDEIAWDLDPKEMLEINPGNYPFYSVPNDGWIQVTTSGPLEGYQKISKTGSLESLAALIADSNEAIVPHVAENNEWETMLTLINPNSSANTITIHPLKAGSDNSHDISIYLKAYEKRRLSLGDIFGWHSGDALFHSMLELKGNIPFAGYYSYRLIAGGDTVMLPLVRFDSLDHSLSLPHYPGLNDWWTGIVVGNPNGDQIRVEIEPYGHDGRLIQELIDTLDIPAGGYQVLLGANLWGERSNDVAFVKFSVDEDKKLCGFYLYGVRKGDMLAGDMLAGANMD